MKAAGEMSAAQAADVLEKYIAWRRRNDDDGPPMQSPTLVGRALDVAVRELRDASAGRKGQPKLYTFNGAPMTLAQIQKLVPIYGKHGLLTHIHAGRNTTEAITTWQRPSPKRRPSNQHFTFSKNVHKKP